jgi:uncharacterized membrane protein
MKRPFLAAAALGAAVGLAIGAMGSIRSQMANPPQIVKDNMARLDQDKLGKCYGIDAVFWNDCAEGGYSCASQTTQARDPKSFVLLVGDCGKIQGGKLVAS